MNQIQAKIAGVFKYPDAKPMMKEMAHGAAYMWQAEPENQFDPNAIALFVGGQDAPIKCGYIPKAIAATMKADEIQSILKGAAFDEILIVKKGTAAT